MKVKTINLKDQTITSGPLIPTILSKVQKYTNKIWSTTAFVPK